MTSKTVDIYLAKHWEEGGEWRSMPKSKKTAYKVVTTLKLPDLSQTLTLRQAEQLVALYGGELIKLSEPEPNFVGYVERWEKANPFICDLPIGPERGRMTTAYYEVRKGVQDEVDALRRSAKRDDYHASYLLRLNSSKIMIGKLAGEVTGFAISDKATKRWVYNVRGKPERLSRFEHEWIEENGSWYGVGREDFIRYIPRTTDVGGAA